MLRGRTHGGCGPQSGIFVHRGERVPGLQCNMGSDQLLKPGLLGAPPRGKKSRVYANVNVYSPCRGPNNDVHVVIIKKGCLPNKNRETAEIYEA